MTISWPFPDNLRKFPGHFRLFHYHFWPFPDHFMAILDRFPTISDPFLTISGRFLTISDPFPTISDHFVNRPTSSRPIPTVSRPPLDQFSVVRHHLSHRGGTTGDHPATETGASSEPSQTTHGRYNTGPQGQNTGRSHRQQQRTHKADVSRSFPEPRLSGLPF